MNSDVYNLIQNAYDIHLAEPTMYRIPATLTGIGQSQSYEGNLHVPVQKPQKRSIQTQAQKGACRISQLVSL